MDKLSKHPLEEDTSASALQERYNFYDEIEYETAFFEADGVTKKKTKHLKRVSRVVSVGDLMEEYRKKLAYYVYHINYVRMSHAVRLERLGFSPGEVSLIMDYSEKLNKTQREAAHSQYWDSVTLTLEVAVAEYYKASLSDADRARLAASLVGVDREKQHAHLREEEALEKLVYYHMSDYKPQAASSKRATRLTRHELLILDSRVGGGGHLAQHALHAQRVAQGRQACQGRHRVAKDGWVR